MKTTEEEERPGKFKWYEKLILIVFGIMLFIVFVILAD